MSTTTMPTLVLTELLRGDPLCDQICKLAAEDRYFEAAVNLQRRKDPRAERACCYVNGIMDGMRLAEQGCRKRIATSPGRWSRGGRLRRSHYRATTAGPHRLAWIALTQPTDTIGGTS